jgi:hypothetical protein
MNYLGVMDIDSYCLPGWPSTVPSVKVHQSKSAKSPRHVLLSSSKADDSIMTNEFLQPNEREQILRRFSARKPESINKYFSY